MKTIEKIIFSYKHVSLPVDEKCENFLEMCEENSNGIKSKYGEHENLFKEMFQELDNFVDIVDNIDKLPDTFLKSNDLKMYPTLFCMMIHYLKNNGCPETLADYKIEYKK